MNERELQLLLTIKDELSGKLTQIQSQLKSTDDATKKTSNSLRGFADALLATGVAYEAFSFLKTSVQAFAEAEASQTRLAILTKNSTGATNEQINSLIEQAKQLEQVGVISASNITTLQGQLATYDLTTESIQTLTPALLNMAVAERGVNVTSQDMISFAEGISQALQGNYQSLTRRGFALDDSTKKIIENGTESERVAEINRVLNTTYKDMNELMTQTTAGAIANLTNRYENLKEELGRVTVAGLLPLMEALVDNANSAGDTSNSFNQLGEIAYRSANLALAGFGALKTGVLTVTAGVDILIAKLTTWDPEKWKEKVGQLESGWGQVLSENAEATKKSFSEFMNPKNFKMPSFDASKIRGGVGGASAFSNLNKGAEEAKKLSTQLGDSYKKMSERIADSLFDLESDHTRSLQSIRDDISQTQESINSLSNDYSRQKVEDERGIAGEIVAVQENVASIREQLAGRISREERKKLEEELAQKEEMLSKNADFIKSIDTSIQAEKRLAGLTDLERAVEEYKSRKALAEQEYNEKVAQFNNELSALRTKESQEMELYNLKKKFIQNSQLEIANVYKQYAEGNLAVTKTNVEKEIAYYNQLADAISRARSGGTVGAVNYSMGKIVTKVNDAIISPNGNVIETHPNDYLIATKNPGELGGGGGVVVNVYGDVTGTEIVDKVQKAIMGNLRANAKINI